MMSQIKAWHFMGTFFPILMSEAARSEFDGYTSLQVEQVETITAKWTGRHDTSGWVHVIVGVDKKRMSGMNATIGSVMEHFNDKAKLWVHVMTPDTDADAVLKAFMPTSTAGRFFFLDGVAFTIHAINAKRVTNLFCIKCGASNEGGANSWQAADPSRFENPTNFARFLMDEVPQVGDDDVAVWLDTDIVLQADISELAKLLRLSKKTVLFVDNSNVTEDVRHFLNSNSKVERLLGKRYIPAYNV